MCKLLCIYTCVCIFLKKKFFCQCCNSVFFLFLLKRWCYYLTHTYPAFVSRVREPGVTASSASKKKENSRRVKKDYFLSLSLSLSFSFHSLNRREKIIYREESCGSPEKVWLVKLTYREKKKKFFNLNIKKTTHVIPYRYIFKIGKLFAY